LVAIGAKDCFHAIRESTILLIVNSVGYDADADLFAMISHKYRLIYVHIPRTAGTSIEQWVQGQDQWLANPSEKHLTAIEARYLFSILVTLLEILHAAQSPTEVYLYAEI